MTIANIKYVESYDSVWDFTEKNFKKIKVLFKEELKDLKEKTTENIANHLIEKGICDEDVIKAVLEKDKKKWFVLYVDEGNGYFRIYEVKE